MVHEKDTDDLWGMPRMGKRRGLTVTMNSWGRYVGHEIWSMTATLEIIAAGRAVRCKETRFHVSVFLLKLQKLATKTRAQRVAREGIVVVGSARVDEVAEEVGRDMGERRCDVYLCYL